MKNSIFLAVILTVLLAFWSCQNDPIDADLEVQSTELTEKKAHSSKLQNKVINSEALKGNFIGNSHTRKLQVYTPPGYKKNGDQSYPVVYLLHGFPFSEKSFVDSSVWDEWISNPYLFSNEYPDFPAEGFRLWVDYLIGEELIEPMIIVMPNAGTEPYGFSFYTNSVLNGNFEDFIVNDLVNYINERYNTIPNASGRAVIGHSQGGYAAIKFGMLHPDVFGTVASHSGLLMVDALFHPDFMYLIGQENPDGFTGPDPTKFLTSAMYGMSSAWSPNLNNPPFLVDLPVEFDENGNLMVVDEVKNLWHQNDVFSLLGNHIEELNSLNIYYDVGLEDELSTDEVHMYIFDPTLQSLGVENYTFETYIGGHHTHMFQRLARSLEFFSNSME